MNIYETIQSRISEFWSNYSKLNFLNVSFTKAKGLKAYADVSHILNLYLLVRTTEIPLILAWLL